MDELLLDIRIEKLEEGGYLATSKSVPGLVAQDRTIAETIESTGRCQKDHRIIHRARGFTAIKTVVQTKGHP
jgi:hypothetical protein